MFTKSYADVFTGDERWRELDVPRATATRGPTPPTSASPLLRGHGPEPEPEPIEGARVLAVLGDS
jgi:aconitate hydratase